MAATVIRKTPGVYITELPAFPPSVVGVETAIPGFIGYTQFAKVNEKPVYLEPIPIGSMADFETYFGGPFKQLYEINEVSCSPLSDTDDYDFSAVNLSTSSPSTCYYKLKPAVPIVPAGRASNASDADVDLDAGLRDEFDEASFNLYNSMRLFYANGGGDCYVVSVGDYTKTVDAEALKKGLDAMEEQKGPTMLVIPDLVLLQHGDDKEWEAPPAYGEVVRKMLDQCGRLQDRVAVIDVYGATNVPDKLALDEILDNFYTATGDKFLNYGMAYFPFLYTSVVPASEVDYQNIVSGDSFDLLTQLLTWQREYLYGPETSPLSSSRSYQVQQLIDGMEPLPAAGNTPAEAVDVTKLNQNLLAMLPLLKTIETDIVAMNSVLPPSGAMAGVYTYVDGARGVWSAPANVSLTSVIQPTYLVNNETQGDMNVPVNGKAIDVLREFPGRGTVVWGARTLDGNSNDYRYIQVRRTLIYIEQSIKAALDPFVFSPNNGNTWTTVVAMVSSFLQGVWSQGGLMGATPTEAFSVQCGLGSTMTAQDILEGYMRVQVVLQMIRPAEFIELTFTQQMQGA
jgi:phage tail sheath protein FI